MDSLKIILTSITMIFFKEVAAEEEVVCYPYKYTFSILFFFFLKTDAIINNDFFFAVINFFYFLRNQITSSYERNDLYKSVDVLIFF